MESAIPSHLLAERSRPKRIPDDYEPPYPSFVARHQPTVTHVVMAYFGVQYQGERPSAVARALDALGSALTGKAGHWDRAVYMDEAGYTNVLTIAYWDERSAFDTWYSDSGTSWTAQAQARPGIGYFVEVLQPSVERYETLFSAADRREGVGVLGDELSGVIQEHAYWGGMRDRIPLSQSDAMRDSGIPEVITDGALRRVRPHENLCLIRSGQDWIDTKGDERAMYIDDVEPVLRAGMDFLRDEGLSVGCISNRYLTVIDDEGRPADKTFGMSWWTSLAALERWSESHPTHLAIFGAAMRYLTTMGPAAQLKLYHEVTVASADQQFFEYLNCHDRTGMLRAR